MAVDLTRAPAVPRGKGSSVKIRVGERIGWTLGSAGRVLMPHTISAFLLIFYTDVFGIPPAAAGTLFLVARIVDGINDPIMGLFVDRLPQTRWGRFRLTMLLGSVLAAIVFSALFAAPALSLAGRLIWAYVTYLLFGIFFDFVSIPGRALMPTMTTRTQDRNALSGLGSIVGILVYIVIAIITLPLVGMFATTQEGWRFTSILYAVATVVLVAIMVLVVRERVQPKKEDRYPLREAYAMIIRNRPLLILLGSFIFSSLSVALIGPASILFFTYNVGMPELFGITSALTAVFMVVATAFFPAVAKRFGKRKTYLIFGLIGFIGNIALFFTPVTAIPLILFWSVVFAIGMGPPQALNQAMTADTTDYAEWKDGVRAEGVIYSSLSFATKLVSGLAGAIMGYVLAATRYVPNAVEQAPQALMGITSVKHLVVGLCILVSAFFIVLYPLTDEKIAEIQADLAARKSESQQ